MKISPLSLMSLHQVINGTERVTFVVQEHGQILGIADVARSEGEAPVLGNLFVVESARKRGIGYQLVHRAQEWAITQKTPLWICVKADSWLVEWYTSCGFEVTGGCRDDDGIWMRWDESNEGVLERNQQLALQKRRQQQTLEFIKRVDQAHKDAANSKLVFGG